MELSKTDKDFRTMVYRKRRLSDTTLTQIVDDPIVSHIFRKFLKGELGEQKLEFFLAAERYRSLPVSTSVSELQREAEKIINTYLGEDSVFRSELGLDIATCDQIFEDLQVRFRKRKSSMMKAGLGSSFRSSSSGFDSQLEVGCSSPDILRRSFLLASMKTFQQLKFEYLPAFITSKSFEELRGDTGFFANEADAVEKASKLLEEMDITFIVNNPIGQHYLCQYIEIMKPFNGFGLDMMGLYEDVCTYEHLYDFESRAKRLERLLRRHMNLAEHIPSLLKLSEDYTANPKSFDKPGASLLQPLEAEIVHKLQKIEGDFKQSDVFRSMTKQIATSSLADLTKINSLNIRSSTRKTIDDVRGFAEARNLKTVDESEISLETVLMNSQGLVFFRRFAIENFMEDSILFWIAVEKYKDTLADMGEAADFEFKQNAGESLAKQFLMGDSAMQINVSSELRERTLAQFRDERTCDENVFNSAQAEVTKLLLNNLWNKFKTTPRYNYLKIRFKEREFIRDTQGHVGQSTIERRRSSLKLPVYNN